MLILLINERCKYSKFIYPSAGHVITGNLKIIPNSRIRNIVSKGPKYKEWKLSIFNIVDQCIKFYSHNTNLLPPKSKSSFRHLKQGIQEFHKKYVLVPAELTRPQTTLLLFVGYSILTLNGTKAYDEISTDE